MANTEWHNQVTNHTIEFLTETFIKENNRLT
uniref:Uncharacterized protein n=1 Tax=Anguilla anguilla TaxID=7936 RepID=A0A0E9VLJ1_ANGAN